MSENTVPASQFHPLLSLAEVGDALRKKFPSVPFFDRSASDFDPSADANEPQDLTEGQKLFALCAQIKDPV